MGYSDILEAAKKLSDKEIKELKNQLEALINRKSQETIDNDKEEYLKLLLNGPTMTDEQYSEYLEGRKHFNTWREKKLF